MSLSVVVREIQREAEKKAATILQEASQQEKRILKEAEDKAGEVVKKARANSKRETEAMKRRELSSTRLSQRKTLLEARARAVKEVVEETRKMIGNMPRGKRIKLLRKGIKRGLKELKGARFYYCNDNDKPIISRMFRSLRFAGKRELLGGAILQSGDRKISVDCSFDRVIDEIAEEKINEVQRILFA